jgi:type VI secretion system secreted protein Hcp
MAQLNHIKFDGIDGEATHKDHPGAIVVDSWAWGVSAPALTGSGASKATPGELHFMHYCDKATPLLARASARGKAIKQVVLSSRKAAKGRRTSSG